jgi:tetratricopeptide (TPR) repeat protein
MTRALASAALAVVLSGPSAARAGTPPDAMTRQMALERYRGGQQLLLRDDFGGAADEFQAAIQLDPSLALAHYGLGQSYMGLKSYVQAIHAFTRCREAYVELTASAADREARFNQWIEDEIRGLKDTQRQIEARLRQQGGVGNSPLQRALGQVIQRLNQLEHLRQRQDHGQEPPAGVSLALGSAYLRSGRMDDAEREYLAALAGNPRMGEAHNNLAYVYMVTGRLAEAERALKLAEKNGFRVKPDFKEELKQKLR